MKKGRLFISLTLVIACGIHIFAHPRISARISVGKGATNDGAFVSAVINSKPEPERPTNFTSKILVTITLIAVFTRDGKVTDIQFLKATPKHWSKAIVKDLTKSCIAAAKQIKFIPARKDGHPVSMYMKLEYAFDPHGETQENNKRNK